VVCDAQIELYGRFPEVRAKGTQIDVAAYRVSVVVLAEAPVEHLERVDGRGVPLEFRMLPVKACAGPGGRRHGTGELTEVAVGVPCLERDWARLIILSWMMSVNWAKRHLLCARMHVLVLIEGYPHPRD